MASRSRSWTPRRVLFGWLYRLLGEPGQRTGVYAVALLVGLMSLASLAIKAWNSERWGAIQDPVATLSVDVECERLFTGGTYFIDVEGRRYECTGADSWCPYRQPAQVVYERARPSDCRFAPNVGKLSRWELASLLGDLSGLSLALAALWIRPDAEHRFRSALGHALFIACVAIALASWCMGVSVMN